VRKRWYLVTPYTTCSSITQQYTAVQQHKVLSLLPSGLTAVLGCGVHDAVLTCQTKHLASSSATCCRQLSKCVSRVLPPPLLQKLLYADSHKSVSPFASVCSSSIEVLICFVLSICCLRVLHRCTECVMYDAGHAAGTETSCTPQRSRTLNIALSTFEVLA
jgi:hypothetical protein